MKSKKVHFTSEINNVRTVSCNSSKSLIATNRTFDPKKVTCESCKNTKAFIEARDKQEKERKASSEELGYEVLDYGEDKHRVKLSKCNYFRDKYIAGNFCSRGCSHNKGIDKTKKQVKCSFKAKNKPKTQLEKDTIKYNLSDEHVEILSKVDYEVVAFKCSKCEDCLLDNAVVCPNDANGDLTCCHSNKEHIFKQVHKTQESLNESIEKEEVEKGIEEPYIWTDAPQLPTDIPVDAPTIRMPIKETKQESKHYQNEKGIPGFKKTLDDMYSIMLAKNSDYAGFDGAFDNFNRVEQIGLVTAEKGLLVRIMDKVGRAVILLDNEAKVNDEAIEDTLLDMANYAVILKCLMESKRIKKEKE